jgi:hypothetical protein
MEFMDTTMYLNAKILRITMLIKDKYPELSKYLDETRESIPNETDPEVMRNKLKVYYDFFKAILSKYIVDHP